MEAERYTKKNFLYYIPKNRVKCHSDMIDIVKYLQDAFSREEASVVINFALEIKENFARLFLTVFSEDDEILYTAIDPTASQMIKLKFGDKFYKAYSDGGASPIVLKLSVQDMEWLGLPTDRSCYDYLSKMEQRLREQDLAPIPFSDFIA